MIVLENILKYRHNHKIKGAKMKVLILDGGKKFGSSGGKLNTLLCDVASSELEAKGYEVIRTKIDSLLFGENLFLYGAPSAEVLWFCESKIVPIPIGTK